jgi:flagellar L-ring protein FlgH
MKLTSFTILLAVIAFDRPAAADSLWQRGRANPVSLICDNRARRVGDIVTIVIDERQRLKQGENTKTEKSSSATSELEFRPAAALTGEINDIIDGFENPLHDLLPIEFTSDRDFEGKADVNKEGSFTTQITALVIDVQPNGNLVLEGRRRVTLDGEEKWMTVTGVARGFDVKTDNTIESALIANANVNYSSAGPLARNTERGWLDSFIDYIWPF